MRKQTGDTYCERTGFLVNHKDIKVEYDGTRVRAESYEPRQPQDFSKVVRGEGAPKYESYQYSYRFVTANDRNLP